MLFARFVTAALLQIYNRKCCFNFDFTNITAQINCLHCLPCLHSGIFDWTDEMDVIDHTPYTFMTTKAPTVLTTTKWSGQVVRESSFPPCHSRRGRTRCSLWLFAYLPRPAQPVTYHHHCAPSYVTQHSPRLSYISCQDGTTVQEVIKRS